MSDKERNDWADSIMDTKEAAEIWGLSQDYIKGLCQKGAIISKKIGKSWAVYRNQANPKKYKT